MSKQDLLKTQTCVLRVNIQCVCEGCKQKIKKILQKVDGVYTVSIDAEQGRVTVSGNVNPANLIKKLEKSGKHAEIWGLQKGVNSNVQNQNIKGDKGNKSQNGIKDQQKGSQQAVVHQMRSAKDMNLSQKEQKSVKFSLPEDKFDMSHLDDGDEEFDDDEEEEEEFGHGHHLANKKMSVMGSNGHGLKGEGPYGKMMPTMSSINQGTYGPNGMSNMHTMNDKKGMGNTGVKLAANKGGDFEGKNENSGKKGENKKGGNKKQGGKYKNGGKDVRGLFGKIFGKKTKKEESSGRIKGTNNGGYSGDVENNSNGGKKSGGDKYNRGHDVNNMKNSYHETDVINISKGGKHDSGGGGGGDRNKGKMVKDGPSGKGQMGPMGQMGDGGLSGKVGQMGPMGHMNHMGNMPALQGLPAQAMINGGYHQPMDAGNPYQQQQYYQGMGHVNPYNQQQQQQQQQQQYMSMMMNQQRGDHGNEMFQPMMYSRPHPSVNYAAPPLPVGEPYHHYFNDENADSCSIM